MLLPTALLTWNLSVLQKHELNLTTGPRGLLFSKRDCKYGENRLFRLGKLLQRIGRCKFAGCTRCSTLASFADVPRTQEWLAM